MAMVVSARLMAPPKVMLAPGLPATLVPSWAEGHPRAPCAPSNTLFCFLSRIDKTMLASLKIK